MFQVVPPCGGHQEACGQKACQGQVSSRAPVWGASDVPVPVHGQAGVSSRAPVWGASASSSVVAGISVVSSRAPVWGASMNYSARGEEGHDVSSRAPVWGASGDVVHVAVHVLVSSRAPVWGASPWPGGALCRAGFQVVPPCGGHPPSCRSCRTSCGFQVVPPCGGHREEDGDVLKHRRVSSRAPVWGASVILHKKHVANLCKICIFLPNCRF